MGDIALRGQGRAMLAKGGSTPAWQRKEGKSESGGLNRKGIASYRRANPGSKLSMAISSAITIGSWSGRNIVYPNPTSIVHSLF